jgi:uncharacterized protein
VTGKLPWRLDGKDVLLSVRLTPRAKKDLAGGLWYDSNGAAWLCASVRAVPEKGLANAGLVELLSKSFLIPASSIALEAGGVSRLKRVRIAGGGDKVIATLQNLAGEA